MNVTIARETHYGGIFISGVEDKDLQKKIRECCVTDGIVSEKLHEVIPGSIVNSYDVSQMVKTGGGLIDYLEDDEQ
jgi:hypothetical protein